MLLIINLLSKIKIHFFFYVIIFIAFITGNFNDFVIFSLIIFIHEIGHVVGGLLFGYEVLSITILPFGGLTKFNNGVNVPLLSTFIVTVMGPLFQVVFYFLLDYFFDITDFIKYYNFILLFFNLIPIYPLDGSKILYVLCCLLFPFKFSHLIIVYVSFGLVLCGFLFISFDFIIYLILFILLIKCILEFKNHNYIFNAFLLERYMYKFKFKKSIVVSGVDRMFVNKNHLFLLGDTYVSEEIILKKMFDKCDKL